MIGGSGTNILSATISAAGGIATLNGGSGNDNTFSIYGPGNYTIFGNASAIVNSLTVQCDNFGDTVDLAQNGSASSLILMSGGSSAGTLTGTATSISSVSVFGGTGSDKLDASGMIMPVTLDGAPPVVVDSVDTHADGGIGGATDTLIGGAGNDTLYYHEDQGDNVYNGGGGTDNRLLYVDTHELDVYILPTSFLVDTSLGGFGNVAGWGQVVSIENYQVVGTPNGTVVGVGDYFNDGRTSVTQIEPPPDGPRSGPTYIGAESGNPNPYLNSNYVEVDQYVNPGGALSWDTDAFILQGVTYDPATQGALTSADFDVYYMNNTPNPGSNHEGDTYLTPAIEQDGQVFVRGLVARCWKHLAPRGRRLVFRFSPDDFCDSLLSRWLGKCERW